MTTKTCSCCKQELPVADFAFKNKAKGTLQSRCKVCQRAYGKQHYEQKKDYYIDKASLSRQTVDARNRAHVKASLEGKHCSCCASTEELTYALPEGETGQPVHQAVHCGLSLESVEQAIARSKVVCRSCLQARHTKALVQKWGRLSSTERSHLKAQRAQGLAPTPDPGRFKNYRRAANDAISAPRDLAA